MSDKTPQKKGKKTPKKGNGKSDGSTKKLVIIVGAVLLVVGAAGGISYSLGLVHALFGWEREQDSAELELGQPVVHPLPEIRTDLKTNECSSPFLRTLVHVQLAPEDVPRLASVQDQVMDAILGHLRDQERQNLVGKQGTERLRFELVQIIQNKIQPAKVHTIIFKELVVQ